MIRNGALPGLSNSVSPPPRVDRFGAYVGAGLTAFGMLPGRPADEFGIAANMARNGAQYVA